MKKIIFPVLIGATMLLSAFTFMSSTNWKILDGYTIKFSSKDPSGAFTSCKGDIVFDADNLGASKFDITIDAASINTGNGMKNGKAKGDDYLDVAKYPNIRFTSSKITKTGSGYEVVGTLAIKDVKKLITIPFTFNNNTFVGSFMVNRVDYHVGGTTGMAMHTAQDLKIDISVPVSKK